MLSKSRINKIKEKVFETEDVPDELAARYAILNDSIDSLEPDIEEEMSEYKKGLIIAAIALALSKKNKDDVFSLLSWDNVAYDASRATQRASMVASAVESWDKRDYLIGSTFVFNQNTKAIDRALSNVIDSRISSYNVQERKRFGIILAEGKKQGWSDSQLASEIKRGAGLNSVQQRAMYNIEKGMRSEGFSASQIKKKSDAYIAKSLAYRGELTARWESANTVNEGQEMLWGQLVAANEISADSSKEWVAILDNVTGTADRAMNGQIVPLSKEFLDPTGQYGLVRRPPLRGNCRCDMILHPKKVS